MDKIREEKNVEIKRKLKEALKVFGIEMEEEEAQGPATPEQEMQGYLGLSHQTQEKIDDLNAQAEALLKKSGMTREVLEAYTTNPNNFTAEQWAAMEKIREAAAEIREETYGALMQSKEAAAPASTPKKKPPFGKKKNWIPL